MVHVIEKILCYEYHLPWGGYGRRLAASQASSLDRRKIELGAPLKYWSAENMGDVVVNTLLSGAIAGAMADILTHPVRTTNADLIDVCCYLERNNLVRVPYFLTDFKHELFAFAKGVYNQGPPDGARSCCLSTSKKGWSAKSNKAKAASASATSS